jgi:hypothetical protein
MDGDDERLLASAVRFLIDGQEEDAANLLLACTFETWESGDTWYSGDEVLHALHIKLSGPRAAYDALNESGNPAGQAIRKAVEAVIPAGTYVKHFTIHAELIDIDPNWRTELLEIARGRGVHNQGVSDPPARVWQNLRFRSASEVRIAQALDRAGVLFLPNCKARLGLDGERENREPDFLVCHLGKFGILEVDGEPFHPPSRTAQDHTRDRLFRAHGVLVVEHFDASECYENAPGVVRRFLAILSKA